MIVHLSFALEKDTKTHDQRAVDMSRDLTRILREHLTWLKAEALRCGWGQPEWLFPNEVGRPLDETKVGRVFRRVLRQAGLPAFRVLVAGALAYAAPLAGDIRAVRR
jgi:site-specific recombinase XerD